MYFLPYLEHRLTMGVQNARMAVEKSIDTIREMVLDGRIKE